jgi:hypothetical protein
VRVEQSLFAIMTDPLASLNGTPLGPIGRPFQHIRRCRAVQSEDRCGWSARGGGAIRIENALGQRQVAACFGQQRRARPIASGRLHIDGISDRRRQPARHAYRHSPGAVL